ncbi:hypothetical protein PRN20_06150 [Devosia sp. ZB163]|uniref:hypothetical protein n=1 Tax=Devosia sp. ZB163 TaxID=3025938 RepID=UPI002362DF01|nr:hypothetical protein [Devosia sp. ZB163]MDC9823306.1 hypothetical protein [Devosia sp. ZB163]
MTHQYAVGQMLEMRSSPTNSRRAGPCEVVFRLPHDSGPLLYRVRPVNDRVERVVAEADLFASTEPRPDVAMVVPAFTIAISRR